MAIEKVKMRIEKCKLTRAIGLLRTQKKEPDLQWQDRLN
jgi:hypothetical protein